MKTPCKFQRIPGTQSRVITKVHDLLGQPSYKGKGDMLWTEATIED